MRESGLGGGDSLRKRSGCCVEKRGGQTTTEQQTDSQTIVSSRLRVFRQDILKISRNNKRKRKKDAGDVQVGVVVVVEHNTGRQRQKDGGKDMKTVLRC